MEWPIIVQMRQWGHDILSVKETRQGEKDENILTLAQKENRVLLTNDLDFGKLVLQQKKKSGGVVLMRFKKETSQNKIKALAHLLKHHAEKLPIHFTVISENQIKIRPLG